MLHHKGSFEDPPPPHPQFDAPQRAVQHSLYQLKRLAGMRLTRKSLVGHLLSLFAILFLFAIAKAGMTSIVK